MLHPGGELSSAAASQGWVRFLEELLRAATPPSIRMDLSSPTHAKSFPLQSLLHPEQREVGTGQKGATGSALALRDPEPSLCPRWATGLVPGSQALHSLELPRFSRDRGGFAVVSVVVVCQGPSCFSSARVPRERFNLSRALQCRSTKPIQTKLILLENK